MAIKPIVRMSNIGPAEIPSCIAAVKPKSTMITAWATGAIAIGKSIWTDVRSMRSRARPPATTPISTRASVDQQPGE